MHRCVITRLQKLAEAIMSTEDISMLLCMDLHGVVWTTFTPTTCSTCKSKSSQLSWAHLPKDYSVLIFFVKGWVVCPMPTKRSSDRDLAANLTSLA